MRRAPRSLLARAGVLLAVALLALGAAACGDQEPGSSGAGGDVPAAGSRQAGAGAEAEAGAGAEAETETRNAEVREEYRERQEAAAPSEEEVAAAETATEFYAILGSDEGGANRTTIDSAAFCELISERARRQTVEYARRASNLGGEWDCEKAVDLLVLRSKRTGGFARAQRAEVIGVNAVGDRATASVRFGKGPITTIALIREDGSWKLAASPTPTPSD